MCVQPGRTIAARHPLERWRPSFAEQDVLSELPLLLIARVRRPRRAPMCLVGRLRGRPTTGLRVSCAARCWSRSLLLVHCATAHLVPLSAHMHPTLFAACPSCLSDDKENAEQEDVKGKAPVAPDDQDGEEDAGEEDAGEEAGEHALLTRCCCVRWWARREGTHRERACCQPERLPHLPAHQAPLPCLPCAGATAETSADSDLQLAWECLESAKVIWERDAKAHAQQLAGESRSFGNQ